MQSKLAVLYMCREAVVSVGVISVCGWKGTADLSLLLGASQLWPTDSVSGNVTCFGWSSVLYCLPPPSFFSSASLLCLHVLLCNQIVRALSASVLLLSVSLIRLLLVGLCFLLQAWQWLTKLMKGRPQDLRAELVKPSLLNGYSKIQLSKVGGGCMLM